MSNKIFISWIDYYSVESDFAISVANLAHNRSEMIYGLHKISGPYVAESRNQIVRNFLNTDAEWLLLLDSDIIINEYVFDTLIETAKETSEKIITGWYYLSPADPSKLDFMTSIGLNSVGFLDFAPENDVVSIDFAGAGICLIHRDVFLKIKNKEKQDNWFVLEHKENNITTEDLYFFYKAKQHGFNLILNTNCFVKHIKRMHLNKEMVGK